MHRIALILLVTVAAAAASSQAAAPKEDVAPGDRQIRQSVLRLFATQRAPHHLKPRMRQNPAQAAGTAVILDDGRILTSAHLVLCARQIYVQPYQSSERIPAKLVAYASGIDLALLTVEEEALNKRAGLSLAPVLPVVRDVVSVYGYPVGGAS